MKRSKDYLIFQIGWVKDEPTKSTNLFFLTVRLETIRTLGKIVEMSDSMQLRSRREAFLEKERKRKG